MPRNSILGDALLCFILAGLLPIFILVFLTGGVPALAHASSRQYDAH